MTDPFLAAHRVCDRLYRLSGPSPISIRDQLIRGTTVVRRLIDGGAVAAGSTMLVLGAGIAGASAAITAAENGIYATLVERSKLPFSAQRYAWSRHIDPTQYDWPVDHCWKAVFPWDASHGKTPFNLLAGSAPSSALRWSQTLNNAQRAYGEFLRVEYEVEWTTDLEPVIGPDGTIEQLQVDLGRLGVTRADLALDAAGFGSERCYFPRTGRKAYEGQHFWGPDTFARLPPETRHVLISGGGDGALQDYIRVVTGQDHPLEIARAANLAPDILHEIQSAEDRAHRGRAWTMTSGTGPYKPHEAPYLAELDRIHAAAARRALSRAAVRQGLGRLIRLAPVPVTVVHSDPYLVCYYGLNRFLAHLLSQYIDGTFGDRDGHPSRTYFPGCKITAIQAVVPSTHQCIATRHGQDRAAGQYSSDGVLTKHECFGKPHRVSFTGRIPGAILPTAQEFDVVILRHGVEPRGGQQAASARQLLPFHLP